MMVEMNRLFIYGLDLSIFNVFGIYLNYMMMSVYEGAR